MRKIPTLFLRDFATRPAGVLTEVTPGCDWVFAGEGVATRKYDGTCVRADGSGEWRARREVRAGRAAPPGFVPLSTDPATGKTVGWKPVALSPFAKFHAEALAVGGRQEWTPGTYELIGPRINGNPERSGTHRLVEHATAERLDVAELTFEGTRARVRAPASADGCESVVRHLPHPARAGSTGVSRPARLRAGARADRRGVRGRC